jgi:hypothetical protein
MSCVIKRVSSDPAVADTYYNGAAGPPTVWTATYASATTYATAYLAMTAAKSARDSQATYPAVLDSDRVVIWDTVSGAEYPVKPLGQA